MLIKHLEKIYTFLMVSRLKSFSQASKRMGISQPAVTQQIKVLENFLNVKLFERRKKGITLTKDGKRFYEIAVKFEQFLHKFETELQEFHQKESPFLIGASFTVGNYYLPECIPYFRELLGRDVHLIIKDNHSILKEVEKGALDVAFTTKQPRGELNYHIWKQDELVVFSNKPLPPTLEPQKLQEYPMICRESKSATRQLIKKIFEEKGIDCDRFQIVGEVHNSTALKNTILNSSRQLVSIISQAVIGDELRNKRLFKTKLEGIQLRRPIYFVYQELTPQTEGILKFINY
ncbi:MAG: LysR family transcriptional regulator [Epsilonproteobacteria bacterium]|jgi:DNA-binding transcriptional LysR family regulator|nr:LysR family transcriptional regulator [Campylobacterota bacterium]NPA89071.1 LysR family transcriptional regulator [Campylobacterota bacterium]